MRRTILAATVMAAALFIPSGVSAAPGVFHPLPHISHRGNGTVTSTNWSGYATYNKTFTDVKGSWT